MMPGTDDRGQTADGPHRHAAAGVPLKPVVQTDQRRAADPRPKEIGRRVGPDPTRYGDWEKDGIASDF